MYGWGSPVRRLSCGPRSPSFQTVATPKPLTPPASHIPSVAVGGTSIFMSALKIAHSFPKSCFPYHGLKEIECAEQTERQIAGNLFAGTQYSRFL